MSRGVEGREIYHDDTDRRWFLRLLGETKRAHHFNLFAYCLMGNHFHLLIQVDEQPLYLSMHRFLTCYSHYFNQRHGRQGHLFQSRYTAPVCRRDSYLTNLLRYIHLNPVRAGLANVPEQWPWSGHHGLAGERRDDLLDLSLLADLRSQSIDDLRRDYLESLRVPLEDQIKVAHEDFENDSQTLEGPNLTMILAGVARERGLNPLDLRDGRRGRAISAAKLLFIERAVRSGHRLTAIAEEMNCSPAAVTLLRKRRS